MKKEKNDINEAAEHLRAAAGLLMKAGKLDRDLGGKVRLRFISKDGRGGWKATRVLLGVDTARRAATREELV